MLSYRSRMTEDLRCGALQDWSWEIAKVWFPANCIFVGMLWTSFPPLQVRFPPSWGG